jgi:heat shock protein HslJ
MKKFFTLGALAILSFASCSSGTSPSEIWESQGVWQLQAIGTTAIPNPGNYTLQFSEDGRVQVRADCNNCFGGYETNGNAITIGPLGCTRAFCGEDSFFDEYVAALSSASAFVRQSNTLDITSSDGAMNFRVAQQ